MLLQSVVGLIFAILLQIQINALIAMVCMVVSLPSYVSLLIGSFKDKVMQKTVSTFKIVNHTDRKMRIRDKNSPVRGIILICRLPVADNYRPRISNYIGIFNACLLERVLTESAMSLLHQCQSRIGHQKLKLYICCRGARSTTDVVSSWLSQPPNYMKFRERLLPDDPCNLSQYLRRMKERCDSLMATFTANSHANASESINTSDQFTWRQATVLEEAKNTRKQDPIGSIVPQRRRRGLSDVTFLSSVGQTQSEMLERCLREAVEDGCEQTLFVNLHVPEISMEIIEKAFSTLDSGVDVVLGRSTSKGCYLAGFRKEDASGRPLATNGIFSYVLWGSRNVYSMLSTNCFSRGRNLTTASLRPVLGEIDSIEDLHLVESYIGFSVRHLAKTIVSVIIPVLNEEDIAVKTVEQLMKNFTGRHVKLEIIIVDGRSTDDTVAQFLLLRNSSPTEEISIRVYRIPDSIKPGWGTQLQYGVEQATGAYYLFLHADAVLSPKWDEAIVRCLNRPGVVAGVYNYMAAVPNQYVWRRHLGWSLYSHALNATRCLSTRKWALAIGEQGLFLHAFYFQMMGGLEGLSISKLPGGSGTARGCLEHGSVAVSSVSSASLPRRWTRRSLVKGLCVEALMLMGRSVGLSSSRLSSLYYRCPRVKCEVNEAY